MRSRPSSTCSGPTSIPRPSRASCSSRFRGRAGSFRCLPTTGAAPGAVPKARDPVRRRRGPVGDRPNRNDVGDPALRGRRARSRRLGEVDRRWPPARGRDRARGGRGRGSRRRPRRHVRRQSHLVRRCPRRARHRLRRASWRRPLRMESAPRQARRSRGAALRDRRGARARPDARLRICRARQTEPKQSSRHSTADSSCPAVSTAT